MQDLTLEILGSFIDVLRRYIEREFTAREQAAIYDQVSAETKRALSSLSKLQYYRITVLTDILRGIDKLCDDPDKSKHHIVEFGIFLAADAQSTSMKLLFMMLTPKLLTEKFPNMYARHTKNGKLVADTSRIKENKVSFTTNGYDYLHHVATGWILYVYRQIGKKNIQIVTNVPRGEANVPGQLHWDVSWD